jgi:8-amino-7-oxononanoate synthase
MSNFTKNTNSLSFYENPNLMAEFKNLVDVLKRNSNEDNRGIIHIYGENDEIYVSYQDLFKKASIILANLQNFGIQRNDELVIQIDENAMFLDVFWACLMGGIIPVPLSVGNNDEHKRKLFKIWEKLANPYLITDEKYLNSLAKIETNHDQNNWIQAIKSKTVFIQGINFTSPAGKLIDPEPDDIAFIQFSSGSTGTPKGIVLTHRNLLTNISAMIEDARLNRDICLSWMPLTHDMGMIGFHLTPMAINQNHYIMPTSLFIRRPVLWLKKANEHQATLLSSPNFGYKYFLTNFKPENAENWDLSHIRLIFNGAEPISADLCNRFLDCLKPYGLSRGVMFTVYGLAEASLGVCFPVPGQEFGTICVDRSTLGIGEKVVELTDLQDQNALVFVKEGKPVRDCYLRICDDGNRELGEKTVGHIQIKGDNVTGGYYNDPQATAEAITEDGWLKTGDLGFIQDGTLVVTGRAKDIIFMCGQNYYPHDLERIAEEVEGVELGKVAACGVLNPETQQEEIIIFMQYRKKAEEFLPLLVQIRKQIQARTSLNVREIIPVRDIPKTTSGKVQRYKLAENYQNREFDEILREIHRLVKEHNWVHREEPRTETEKALLAICREELGRDDFGTGDNLLELGGNSLLLAKVQTRLEPIFPGRVAIADIFTYPTVTELAGFIDDQSRMPGAHPGENQPKRVYRRTFAETQYEKEFAVSDTDTIDCLQSSLMDFTQGPELDFLTIADRLDMVDSFLEDVFRKRYLQYRRVSLTGSGPVMEISDLYTGRKKTMINLASNDYLNLTKHPRVIKAGIEALQNYGAGAGSVPLLGGTLDLHVKLEQKIAQFKSCEAAIVFTSGFGSNVAALSTILRKNDAAIMDAYVHASLIDGCKETNKLFFAHNDLGSLEKVLESSWSKYANRLVVVDGVYSMDGDIAPLNEIVELAHAYDALVMVDEAHASGVIGKQGKGTPEHCGVEGEVDFVAGTLSKALGATGGFIAASKKAVRYLQFMARPYVFSTAPVPAVAGALIEAIDVIVEEPGLRDKLWWNIRYFKEQLLNLGFNLGNAETAIFPLIIGDTYQVYEMCKMMHEAGIYANPVVYPAVPMGLSRIRMSLTSGLEKEQLDKTLEVLESTGKKLGVI